MNRKIMNHRQAGNRQNRWRDAVFFALRGTLVPFLMREVVRRKRPVILVYHDLQPGVAERHFRVLRRSYNLISLADYVDALEKGQAKRLPPKSLVITLDDGHRGNFQLLPLLRQHHIRPTIFLCSGLLDSRRNFWWQYQLSEDEVQSLKIVSDEERLKSLRLCGFEETKEFEDRKALSRQEIEQMKGQVDFQSHTVFHPILPRCGDQKSRREVTLSKQRLEEDYGLSIYALAFPNGDYSEREIVLAREAGYRCALTLDDSAHRDDADLFRLPRISIPDDAGVSELLVKASGCWQLLTRTLQKVQSGWRRPDPNQASEKGVLESSKGPTADDSAGQVGSLMGLRE